MRRATKEIGLGVIILFFLTISIGCILALFTYLNIIRYHGKMVDYCELLKTATKIKSIRLIIKYKHACGMFYGPKILSRIWTVFQRIVSNLKLIIVKNIIDH